MEKSSSGRNFRQLLSIAVVLFAHQFSFAQAGDYRAPRTPDGNPDLNGFWQAMGTAHWDLQTHESRAGPLWQLGALGAIPGGVGVVEGEEIPYRPEALAKKQENQAAWMELDPVVKCYMPGIPRANYMPYPFQLFQTPDHLLFAYQFASASRNVFMNRPDYEAPILTVMGHNLGHWEGETLVINVGDQYDFTWLDSSGNYHSENMKVTEHFTATGPNTLHYEATIDDPEVFTRPWKISMPLYRRQEANMRLVEFKCQEYSEEILYGRLRQTPEAAQRAAERAAQQ
ncbi:MAG: hypothetical protein QGG67_21255 [Gammaproteobacteria bacterium]|jgi:hypothetical protein|nr:hypothetical protein [Gammaproteobacteria bacterium]MDP6098471.1 hypothetical protein [Gammaproteobacteria bacterium]MDP7455719.1 hypothetical protein [Gammaproteobacteria bacterium]HJO12952.1 hypothetical protein [Gammaproteobacteria bacterium]|tara:strand:- start:2452 stop:3306 length:855 start_codon:yes stop_codon:yes gene_type:complete